MDAAVERPRRVGFKREAAGGAATPGARCLADNKWPTACGDVDAQMHLAIVGEEAPPPATAGGADAEEDEDDEDLDMDDLDMDLSQSQKSENH